MTDPEEMQCAGCGKQVHPNDEHSTLELVWRDWTRAGKSSEPLTETRFICRRCATGVKIQEKLRLSRKKKLCEN